MRIDRHSLSALLLVITRMIKADSRIDADEISLLIGLEQQYGFDRSLMNEASRLTLAEAIAQLRTLDVDVRRTMMQSLTQLACSDEVMERHEAMLLLTLRYCLLDEGLHCEVVSSRKSHRGGDLGTYLIYFESETDLAIHARLQQDWAQLERLLRGQGLSLLYVEHIVGQLTALEPRIVRTLLGYLAPSLSDAQVEDLCQRTSRMDTATFGREVLVRNLELQELRTASPSLLVNLGTTDFLRIPLTQEPLTLIRQLLDDYGQLVSPEAKGGHTLEDDSEQGHFRYYSYYRDFFNLLVEAEPKVSRIVVWPNKSEFEFPDADRKLKLKPQEAALYCLILCCTYKYNRKGLPLCYTPEQRQIEALYRRIYCRKKFVDEKAVVFPESLAPLRSKIEDKMAKQLEGLDNLEDFIPRNVGQEGFYRITAPVQLVMVRPDYRQEEVGIEEFEW